MSSADVFERFLAGNFPGLALGLWETKSVTQYICGQKHEVEFRLGPYKLFTSRILRFQISLSCGVLELQLGICFISACIPKKKNRLPLNRGPNMNTANHLHPQ